MHYSKWEWQNIALAAVAQSAALVDELATRGKADTLPVAACINPLLKFNPSSAAEVYPNITQLSMGLRTMQDVFSGISQEQNSEVIRYLLGMLALRQKLMGDPDMQNQVQEGLQKVIPVSLVGPEEATDGEPELVDRETEEYYKQLAGVYQDTISTYTFRIHVKGNIEHLRNEKIANEIRALLLAGIRSAVLWYQIGGRRWHLILYRKKIRVTASHIRRHLLSSV